MVDLNQFEVSLNEMENKLLEWSAEAVDARHGVYGDPAGKLTTGSAESPAEALDYLRRVRARADRVDELLAASKRARGRARRALAAVAFDTENIISEKVSTARRAEFESFRQRESDAKTASFDQLRNQHFAKRLMDVADEAVDVINQMHWSLDAIRKDLRGTLHALQFESSLER